MNFLIIGNGGREHAFAWKISQSSLVQKVFIAPGNAGTERENKCENINIDSEDISALRDFAIEKSIDLTIVGPEAPLVKGIVDEFEKNNLLILGPSKKASQIEGSKKFMKDFLKKNHIRTAEYEVFEDYEESKEYISASKFPIVIKADGLAAGKGVTIAHSAEEAHKALDDAMQKKIFGSAGTKVVIEDFLEGEEASFIVLCDGKKTIPFASSQDHKARDNNDLGPNTGGMGAYSPAPIVTEEIHKQVMKKIITTDPMKSKHLNKSLDQFAEEGLIKLFKTIVGDHKIVGVVGILQFDVLQHRIQSEYNIPVKFENTQYKTARWLKGEQKQIEKFTKANINQMAKDNDNDYVYLIRIDWDLEKSIRENPNINFIKVKETNNDNN